MESNQTNNVLQSAEPVETPQLPKPNKKWISSLVVIVLLASAGYFLYTTYMSDSNREKEITMNEEQEQTQNDAVSIKMSIQQSFVEFKKILEMKDSVAYVKYLVKVQGLEDVKEEDIAADEAIVEQMEQIHAFFKDITPEDLTSDTTVWTTKEEEVTVEINKKDARGLGETFTFVFIKIGTAWYLNI